MTLHLKKDKNIKAGQKALAHVTFERASDEEIKKALGDVSSIPEGYVAGWASTADIDSYGHKVMAGAFSESIAQRGLKGPKAIKLLIGHNWNQLAGEIVRLEYRGDRLWIEAQMALDIGYVADAYKAAKILGGTNFSVGFMLQDYSWKEMQPGGREYLQIDKGDLFEVSIVPFPGNEEATMTFIKSADQKDSLANDGESTYDPDDSDTTMSSVSEFEKTLVLNGIVKSRQQAHEIVKMVKLNLELFKPKAEPVSTEGNKEPGPVLDLDKLTQLAAKVAEMKSILAPVAK